jgi:hypothetical protein
MNKKESKEATMKTSEKSTSSPEVMEGNEKESESVKMIEWRLNRGGIDEYSLFPTKRLTTGERYTKSTTDRQQ